MNFYRRVDFPVNGVGRGVVKYVGRTLDDCPVRIYM
jgi:hypothetical protein